MGRFLFYFSYVGTRYRGLQRQSTTGIDDTVQGRLVDFTRDVLRRDLRDPTATLSSLVSSRTDVGVHALNNTITVDFPDRKLNGEQHDLMTIQKILNMKLGKKGEEISPPFSMDKFLQAAEVMCGTNNFTSFTSVKKIKEEFKNPVRTVSINVKRGAPYMAGSTEECQEKLEFWDVHIISKSFMYKQIRRMVNGLVAVACDMCSVEDLRQTLKDPAYKVKILERSFPPWALFLNNVEYYPKDLIYPGPLPQLQKEYRTLTKTLERYLHLQGYNNDIGDRTLDTINLPDSCSVHNNEESKKNNAINSIEQISDSDSLHCVGEALNLNEFSYYISRNGDKNNSGPTHSDETVDSGIQINSKG